MSEAAPEHAPRTGDIAGLAEHLFRHEAGKLVSVLTGIFGMDRLQMAEDVVQEALARALQTWPFYGVPANPAAWLTQTAKNLALDLLRREKSFRDKEAKIVATFEQWGGGEGEDPLLEGEIKDSRLRLIFACCHPALPHEDQTALALKTLCGFSPAEIAAAFLTSEVAVTKRLVRARAKVREAQIAFEIPSGAELSPRLDAVMQTLYLLFNEGYKASSGDNLIRQDLCDEAIRLATCVAEHPVGNQPAVHALLALMHLNAARIPARVDAQGNFRRLKDQDRSLWNKAQIARGLYHLNESASGAVMTEYHTQAGISACHCTAASYEATDWPRILALYDRLIEIDNSPVIALNRAVAVAQVHGPASGVAAVEAIQKKRTLENYYLFHAVLAEFEEQQQNFAAAASHLRRAVEHSGVSSERAFLNRRLEECESLAAPAQKTGDWAG